VYSNARRARKHPGIAQRIAELQVKLLPGPEDMKALYEHALAPGLRALRCVDAPQAHSLRPAFMHYADRIPVADADDLAGEIFREQDSCECGEQEQAYGHCASVAAGSGQTFSREAGRHHHLSHSLWLTFFVCCSFEALSMFAAALAVAAFGG